MEKPKITRAVRVNRGAKLPSPQEQTVDTQAILKDDALDSQAPLGGEYNADDLVFALDIGTRSVVGLVGLCENGGFTVIDFEQRHHEERAMRDGQIENISLVGSVVKNVKEALEGRIGHRLTKVSIAAAGRSLKTVKALYEQEMSGEEVISSEMLATMEYSALNTAFESFSTGAQGGDFHCVGYSVISYTLDEYNMASLLGHKGKQVSIELIAAFLPHNVVEGLYSVMELNGLEVSNLTLEPMAAINLIVQKDIRLLNIAIVDIGAGTSDIAISKNGAIVAYDMVTVAGDEITEALMRRYLIDFDTAEQIKIKFNQENDIEFYDILGNAFKISADEAYGQVEESVKYLAGTISKHILEINGATPVAVFLVGGGSQLKGLCQMVAQELDMKKEYVAQGGKAGFKNVKLCSPKLQSPEFVTPIGIGAIMGQYRGVELLSIYVNGKKLMWLNRGDMKVIDALFLAGIKPAKLLSVPSKPCHYFLNGEKIGYKIEEITPGRLVLNGVETSVTAPVKAGDKIEAAISEVMAVKPPVLSEIIEKIAGFYVKLKGKDIEIPTQITVNNEIMPADYEIKHGDIIITHKPEKISQVLEFIGIDTRNKEVLANNSVVDMESDVKSGDELTLVDVTLDRLENVPQALREPEKHGEHIALISEKMENVESGDLQKPQADMIKVRLNGSYVAVPRDSLFLSLLNFSDIDTQPSEGVLVLTLNGKSAQYTDLLGPGDDAEIRWDAENT